MAANFTLEDLLNALIALEAIGHKNYKRLSETAYDPKLKAYFSTLAAMELKHRNIFEDMKEKAILYPQVPMSHEYQAYLKSLLANTLRFVKLFEVQVTNDEVYDDFDAAFDLAIGLEKDAILFLGEMRRMSVPDHHSIIDQLADEERSHLRFLYEYATSPEQTSFLASHKL